MTSYYQANVGKYSAFEGDTTEKLIASMVEYYLPNGQCPDVIELIQYTEDEERFADENQLLEFNRKLFDAMMDAVAEEGYAASDEKYLRSFAGRL